ncbi:hypothetical protein [Enterococcus sp. AZ126]|uniref:hypothetical protein n=1 Tax=Enterococcus sp. AZ126 TaxID=2774635 RepID=UPI003F26C92F
MTKLTIELRDGKNYDTGKPLTDLEKVQRMATVASMIAAMGIARYYAKHPLTVGQITPKRTPATGSKDGKNFTLDRNKSKGNWSVKIPSGSNLRNVIKNGGKMPNHIVIQKGGLSKDGKPNSSADILNPDGSVKQRRYYDEKGRATEDIDYNHSDDGTHEFTHRHKWDWSNPEKPKRLK